MAAKKDEQETQQAAGNPLRSLKIPAAPPAARAGNPPPATTESGGADSGAKPRSDEEKATIELSLYLRPSHDDKLEDLRRSYKQRTHKKISANEVMRRLIERATLDSIL